MIVSSKSCRALSQKSTSIPQFSIPTGNSESVLEYICTLLSLTIVKALILGGLSLIDGNKACVPSTYQSH